MKCGNRVVLAGWITWAVSAGAAEAGRSAMPNGFTGTQGGLTGEVIRVTSLDAAGPGTLSAAFEVRGARLVIFEVGGIIDLGRKGLSVNEPFVTVAGETAPPPGITIIRGGISIQTHDVVIRHVRVRPGDAGRPKKSGWETDAISTAGASAHDIVVEQCSVTWATDENLTASGPRLEGAEATSRRVTFRNNIIAEGLHNSTHGKGRHSKGSLIHDFCTDIAVIGNLYAHNDQRNPYFKAHTTGVIVNNVVYNPGSNAIQLGYSASEWVGSRFEPKNCRVSIVGNVLMHGADTRRDLALVTRPGDAYLEDNLAFDREGAPVAIHDAAVTHLEMKPVWPDRLSPVPGGMVVEHVLAHAGARPWDRDATDERIVRSVRERTGRIIDSQDEVGGYPSAESTRRVLTVPSANRAAWLAGFEAPVSRPGEPIRRR